MNPTKHLSRLEEDDLHLAYGMLRLTLGVNMLLHGLVRIVGGVEVFAAGMTRQFADTVLPAALIQTFGTVLPFIEFAIGALLVLGAFTRAALLAGGALMIALVFGTALRSEWETVGGQMLYALIYAVLLALVRADAYSVDALRIRGQRVGGQHGDAARASVPPVQVLDKR